MRTLVLLTLVTIGASAFVFPQETDGVEEDYKYEKLEAVYRNLELNTMTFDDVKVRWIVTDPMFIRELFNRFIQENALRVRGERPTFERLKAATKDIQQGRINVEIKRRYYDNEIQTLRFFMAPEYLSAEDTSDYFFDEIYDYVYIKRILGDKVYDLLTKRFYSADDVTKTVHYHTEGRNFDLYLNLFDAHATVWNYTLDQSNKFFGTGFGKWGNDVIVFPGWYYPQYFVGMRFEYKTYRFVNIENTDEEVAQTNADYRAAFGMGFPAKNINETSESSVGIRPALFQTTQNMYVALHGNPLGMATPVLEDLIITLEGSLPMTEAVVADYEMEFPSVFWTNKTYFTAAFDKTKLYEIPDIGILSAAIKVGVFDVGKYFLDPAETELIELVPPEYHIVPAAGFGIRRFGGIVGYDLDVMFHYDIESIMQLDVNMRFLISNTYGVEIKYVSGLSDMPEYRDEAYFAFSPILRINY
ncbi:MAG: hypothetical protein GF419_14645 [Ignavibacteriales bacterium]|nr:hypothetical protein [Ignavibacteriales bacterium]